MQEISHDFLANIQDAARLKDKDKTIELLRAVGKESLVDFDALIAERMQLRDDVSVMDNGLNLIMSASERDPEYLQKALERVVERAKTETNLQSALDELLSLKKNRKFLK